MGIFEGSFLFFRPMAQLPTSSLSENAKHTVKLPLRCFNARIFEGSFSFFRPMAQLPTSSLSENGKINPN